jgi:hypothetical protein
MAPQRVVDVAAVGPGALVVVSAADYNPVDHERTVERWSERRGAEPLFMIRLRDVIGEGVAAAGDGRWWYTVAGNYENRWGALFVSSAGAATVAPRLVSLPIGSEHRWLALKGEVPAGLHLFRDGEETRVTEVTAEGVRRTWMIQGARLAARRWWAAERLADGSIALASLEALPERLPSKVILRILRGGRDEPAYDEFILQNGGEAVSIAAAVQRSGVLMVVVERPQGAIDAFIVEPRSGKSSRLVLSSSEEKARYPAIVATEAGFAVAWADLAARPAVIRARSVENGSAGLVAATIGPVVVTPDSEPSFRIAFENQEDVFVWERADGPAQRRLPAELAAFELVTELKERLCSFGRARN